MTRVKICCIASIEEARLALEAGAHAIGLVSAMPSGPGVISEDRIAEIAAATHGQLRRFLLTSLREVEAIGEQAERCGVDTIQLVDRIEAGAHEQLRQRLSGVSLVQVIHVRDEGSVDEASTIANEVDALLLDSGDPSAFELGGTGRVHDWALSRRIVESVKIPVYLAGGLRSSNVAAAIRQVRPFGVDVCSGVRTSDRLDPLELRRFFAAVASVRETD